MKTIIIAIGYAIILAGLNTGFASAAEEMERDTMMEQYLYDGTSYNQTPRSYPQLDAQHLAPVLVAIGSEETGEQFVQRYNEQSNGVEQATMVLHLVADLRDKTEEVIFSLKGDDGHAHVRDGVAILSAIESLELGLGPDLQHIVTITIRRHNTVERLQEAIGEHVMEV